MEIHSLHKNYVKFTKGSDFKLFPLLIWKLQIIALFVVDASTNKYVTKLNNNVVLSAQVSECNFWKF